MSSSRGAALNALLRVDEDAGYSNLVLDKELSRAALDPRDAALASAVFYGVLERRMTLDYVLNQFSSKSTEKMTPVVREVLRMGAYQILYLDKIPESAAVNESVRLAKENGAAKASGFVNAVLRSLLRGRNTVSWPNRQSNPVRALSIAYSCPEWLVSLWRGAYGENCAQLLLESLFSRPPVFVRVNNLRVSKENLRKRLEEEGVAAQSVPWLENALSLEQTGALGALPSFQEGLFHVQDLSSQLCCRLLNPRPGERVLDLCAAPGGKTFTIAEQMEDRGEVLSFDKYKGKAGLIRQGAERLGLTVVNASVRDALAPNEALAPADRVLCDAPCSGLGILRRKPEIRYKSKSALDSLPDLQYRILCTACELVKSGGVLLYSTCTLNPQENAGVADRFLREHPEFLPRPLNLPPQLRRALQEPEHQLTLLPHAHGTDGFFLASFQKQ